MQIRSNSLNPTGELVFRTRDGGAVFLVGGVGAVLEAVAFPKHGDTQVVLTPELAIVARWEITVGLI